MRPRAIEACRAPILDGFDEDWAHDARQAHAERLAEALERLAAATADPAEAVRLTREQVALDPLAEEPNRRLIERLAPAGDRAAALAAGERFAERLRSALGDRAVARDARAARRAAARPGRPASHRRARSCAPTTPRSSAAAPSSSACAPRGRACERTRDRRHRR